jgi:hypothetical protein
MGWLSSLKIGAIVGRCWWLVVLQVLVWEVEICAKTGVDFS